MLLSKAIELMELEIRRLQSLVMDLRERKLYRREAYRACEVKRFERILDLLVREEANWEADDEYN